MCGLCKEQLTRIHGSYKNPDNYIPNSYYRGLCYPLCGRMTYKPMSDPLTADTCRLCGLGLRHPASTSLTRKSDTQRMMYETDDTRNNYNGVMYG
ncbi:MAG: hypothetical protein J07HR59_00051 [Halorubrum sp. J07HR59]|nr:MAG: hypothetical protein J07HR59_00051 [Halorubrum sp. J07HR59]